jgi:hypothetical protein
MPRKSSKKPVEKKEGKKTPQKKSKGKTTKQLIDLHMKDKNHVFTAEEIKNVDLGLNNPDTTTSHTPEISNNEERPKDEDKDHEMVTPWDTINE